MTDPEQHDHDPDAALMERVEQIAQEERRDCTCECADVKTCDIVGRLALRVARAEGKLTSCHNALEAIADDLGDDVAALLWHKAGGMTIGQVGYAANPDRKEKTP